MRIDTTRWPRALRPLPAGEYVLTRWLFLRGLGLVYVCAFGALAPQVRGLIGQDGILPVGAYLAGAGDPADPGRLWQLPTLLWLSPSDGFLVGLCAAGLILALLVIVGVLPGPALVGCWACYLSLVTVGQDFLSFQWDTLLVETGFLAIFFAPWQVLSGRPRETPPSSLVLWLLRLLLFRLMFSSGVVKLASGDPTWRNLTALSYHYASQPLPTPLGWWMFQLPAGFHTASTALTLVIELVVPCFIFAPRPVRALAAGLLVGLQALIAATGNFAFFNLLTVVLCIVLLDDRLLRRLAPAGGWGAAGARPALARPARLRPLLLVPLAAVILTLNAVQLAAVLSWGERIPAPAIDFAVAVDPWHFVSGYGLFAVMTTTRPEIAVEGSADGQTWQEYGFVARAGDPRRPPVWVAPGQPRLDWQMWFAALGSAEGNPWFGNFLRRLLQGSPEVLRLLAHNPFPNAPPRYVRAVVYNYWFTDIPAWRAGGAWWRRDYAGIYVPALSLAGR